MHALVGAGTLDETGLTTNLGGNLGYVSLALHLSCRLFIATELAG